MVLFNVLLFSGLLFSGLLNSVLLFSGLLESVPLSIVPSRYAEREACRDGELPELIRLEEPSCSS